MYSSASGLGLAPAVAAGLLTIGGKLAGSLFGPTENDILEREARAGNVVAWWRLKAKAGQFLASTTIAPLTAEETGALAVALGPAATQEAGLTAALSARAHLRNLEADGTAAWLASKARELLTGASAEPALAGIPAKWILVAGVGYILFSLFRR